MFGQQTTFSDFVSFLLIGFLNLLPIWIGLSFIVLDSDVESLRDIIFRQIAVIKAYPTSIFALTTLCALLLGLFLDLLGHYIDERLNFSRAVLVPQNHQNLIMTSDIAANGLNFDDVQESLFYAHVPQHLLRYHEDVWRYYEFFRSLCITTFIYLVIGDIILYQITDFLYVVLWTIATAVAITLFFWGMKWLAEYYYRVETLYVIEWLRQNSPSSATETGSGNDVIPDVPS